MTRFLRRYEILLPLLFNDGTPVPDAVVAQTLEALENQFGAVSAETAPLEGRWRHEGTTYRDNLIRVFADVPENPENRAFMTDFKETLKERFEQIDIWIVSFQLEVH